MRSSYLPSKLRFLGQIGIYLYKKGENKWFDKEKDKIRALFLLWTDFPTRKLFTKVVTCGSSSKTSKRETKENPRNLSRG